MLTGFVVSRRPELIFAAGFISALVAVAIVILWHRIITFLRHATLARRNANNHADITGRIRGRS